MLVTGGGDKSGKLTRETALSAFYTLVKMYPAITSPVQLNLSSARSHDKLHEFKPARGGSEGHSLLNYAG